MTAVATNDAWQEKCLIAISKIGGSDIQFASLTETVDFSLGEKDIEGIPLVNGGRMTKFTPEGDSSITFEAYPLQAGTDTGTTGKGFFDLLHQVDASVPIRITNSSLRDKYRVLVLWTNDPSVTTGQGSTAANYSALRIGLADGYFTSVKPSFTDGVLKFTVTYKCSAFDKSGNSCVLAESCAAGGGDDALPVIADYTTSNKFG